MGSNTWDGVNPPTELIDFTGQTIRVGDAVVYPMGHTITVGILLEFLTHKVDGTAYGNSKGKHIFKLKIKPVVDSNCDSKYAWAGRRAGEDHKPSYLNYVDKVLKVPNSIVENLNVVCSADS